MTVEEVRGGLGPALLPHLFEQIIVGWVVPILVRVQLADREDLRFVLLVAVHYVDDAHLDDAIGCPDSHEVGAVALLEGRTPPSRPRRTIRYAAAMMKAPPASNPTSPMIQPARQDPCRSARRRFA